MYFVFFFNKACLVQSTCIYQRPRINTIAPNDQFRRLQISAELLNAVTTHDYASLFASIGTIRTIRALFVLFSIRYSRLFANIRTIRTIFYSLFATIRYSGFPGGPKYLV